MSRRGPHASWGSYGDRAGTRVRAKPGAVDGRVPDDKRVAFVQSEEWERRNGGRSVGGVTMSQDIFSDGHCCYCFRPVKADAPKLALSRTNDGAWWAVKPGAEELPDERQMGRFTLPIGPDCLRQHHEWHFAVVPRDDKAESGA